jgi:hypothetical protein
MLQPIFEEMYEFASLYLSEPTYYKLPRKTDKDKLKLLALIYHNELSYFLHKTRVSYGLLDNDKIIEILLFCANIFKNDINKFIIAKAKHQARVATIKSPLYLKWKNECKLALHNYRYCFKCNSILGLEIDHIESRYSNPSKEYDILNSQYLCKKCNQLKSSDSVDYRTEEIKEAQLEYVRIHHKGKSIIS